MGSIKHIADDGPNCPEDAKKWHEYGDDEKDRNVYCGKHFKNCYHKHKFIFNLSDILIYRVQFYENYFNKDM